MGSDNCTDDVKYLSNMIVKPGFDRLRIQIIAEGRVAGLPAALMLAQCGPIRLCGKVYFYHKCQPPYWDGPKAQIYLERKHVLLGLRACGRNVYLEVLATAEPCLSLDVQAIHRIGRNLLRHLSCRPKFECVREVHLRIDALNLSPSILDRLHRKRQRVSEFTKRSSRRVKNDDGGRSLEYGRKKKGRVSIQIYDKLAELGPRQDKLKMLQKLVWKCEQPRWVTRIEFRLHREFFNKKTVAEVLSELPLTVKQLFDNVLRFTTRPSSTKHRLSTHPIWQSIRDAVLLWAETPRPVESFIRPPQDKKLRDNLIAQVCGLLPGILAWSSREQIQNISDGDEVRRWLGQLFDPHLQKIIKKAEWRRKDGAKMPEHL